MLPLFRILDRQTCREHVLAVNALTDYIISQCSAEKNSEEFLPMVSKRSFYPINIFAIPFCCHCVYGFHIWRLMLIFIALAVVRGDHNCFFFQMIRVLNMMVFHRHVMTFDRLLLSLVLHPATDHASQIAMVIVQVGSTHSSQNMLISCFSFLFTNQKRELVFFRFFFVVNMECFHIYFSRLFWTAQKSTSELISIADTSLNVTWMLQSTSVALLSTTGLVQLDDLVNFKFFFCKFCRNSRRWHSLRWPTDLRWWLRWSILERTIRYIMGAWLSGCCQ